MNPFYQSEEHSFHFLCKVTGKRVHKQEKGFFIAFHPFTYTLWLPFSTAMSDHFPPLRHLYSCKYGTSTSLQQAHPHKF